MALLPILAFLLVLSSASTASAAPAGQSHEYPETSLFMPLQQALPSLPLSNFTQSIESPMWNPTKWSPLVIYALLISLFVVSIAYMIAELIRSPQLNAWAKSELYEFIVSCVLVGGLYFALTIMNLFVFEMTGGFDHFAMANSYLDVVAGAPTGLNIFGSAPVGSITKSYMVLSTLYITATTLGSFASQAAIGFSGVPAFKISLNPLGGLEQFSVPLLSLVDFTAVVLMAMIAQKSLLVFFKETMLTFFLPLGVVLRAFPLSRKLGATIIAIAITCYVIFPLTLVMNLGIYDAVPHETSITPESFSPSTYTGCISGRTCSSEKDCCGAPCASGICQPCPTAGLGCVTPQQCCGAPCESPAPATPPVCTTCPGVGAACATSKDCCDAPCNPSTNQCEACLKEGDVCDPNIPDPCCGLACVKDDPAGPSRCRVFPLSMLFYSTGALKQTTDPSGCTAPDPPTCTVDADCVCSKKCIWVPDSNPPYNLIQKCAGPSFTQADYDSLRSAPDAFQCRPILSTCWWANIFHISDQVFQKYQSFHTGILELFFRPLFIPKGFFILLSNLLPTLFWPVVAASTLGVADIIICITFFRSISESIGGESSIIGLSRAL